MKKRIKEKYVIWILFWVGFFETILILLTYWWSFFNTGGEWFGMAFNHFGEFWLEFIFFHIILVLIIITVIKRKRNES